MDTKVESVLSEDQVMDLLGMSASSLANLRYNQGLPFARMTRMCRVYLETPLMEWLNKRLPPTLT